jgi:hypothetical protein
MDIEPKMATHDVEGEMKLTGWMISRLSQYLHSPAAAIRDHTR